MSAKDLRIIPVVLLFGLSAFCQAYATNANTQVKITLTDGSYITGETQLKAIPISARSLQDKKVNIPLALIRSINVSSNELEISCVNGDKIAGTSGINKIEIQSSVGPVAIDLKHISGIHVMTARGLHPYDKYDGLIGYWPFDGNANDYSGHELNGTVVGASLTEDRNGKIGGAYYVGKRLGYIQVPDNDMWSFGLKSFAICLWLKLDIPPYGEQVIIGHDEGGGERNKWAFMFGAGSICFHINNPNGVNCRIASFPWVPQAGKWYHLTVTRDKMLYSIYIDGVCVSTDNNQQPVPAVIAPLTIGQAEKLYIEGALDEVSIFNRALSHDEIWQIYSAAK